MSLEQSTITDASRIAFSITVTRKIADAEVSFSTAAFTAGDALRVAHQLAGADVPAATPNAPVTPTPDEAVAKTESKSTTKTKKEPEAKKTEAEKRAPTPNADGPADTAGSADDAPAGLTYDDVKARILAMSKDKGREVVVALMQRYGVTKGPDLKESQFADFIKDADLVLSGEYNPLDSELA